MIHNRSSCMAISLSLALLVSPASFGADVPPTAPADGSTGIPSEPAPEDSVEASATPSETSSEQPEPEPQPSPAEATVEQVAPPVPPSEPAPQIAGTTRTTKRDYSVPLYQQKRPQWGLELAVSPHSAFGAEGRLAGADSSGLRSFQILGEYQPQWFQTAGVLGLGASIGLYSTDPSNQVTRNLSGLLSYGYQARYEARFIRNQWIVPTVGYAGEWVRYALTNQASGTVSAGGVFYGAMILLSAFDEGSAAEMYANVGVSRVYLLAESRSREGSDANLTLSGRSYFFGLRFEF